MKIPSVKRITDTPPSLEEAQGMVGGLVEIVYVGDKQLLCHEEALFKDPAVQNPEASELAGTPIFGEAVLLSGDALWD